MAATITGGAGTVPMPRAEPALAPTSAPKQPKDNTAAGQLPKETRAAVGNSFGRVPQKDNAKPPASPKVNADAPAPDPKSPAGTQASSPVAPAIQAILDAKLPDGKTLKEKLDTDGPAYIIKAAQNHYNAQRDKGEALDAVSQFYLNNSARYIVENGIKDDKIPAEKMAEVFDLDKIARNLEALSGDPALGTWISEQQANFVENTITGDPGLAALVAPHKQEGENNVNALRRLQSDYLGGAAFADAVAKAANDEDGRKLAADGMKTLSTLGLGEKEMRGVANTMAENIRSKYMPDAPKVVIDPHTNKPVQTDAGDSLAQLPDGTHIALGKDGKPVADKQGNPWVYQQDGYPRRDANNAYVQYDPKANTTYASYGGIKYMVGPDGKGRTDAQGQWLAVDSEGGAPVAVGADGKVAVDAQGNKAVINPETGKQVVAPDTGNKVVIDAKTKGVVQAGADGKVVASANGDPYAVDQKTGKFVTDAKGRYVQISKENVAPGIVPGYVVDENNTRIVVNPANGKPLIDPASGKTIIFSPDTKAPELAPLDAGGKPRLAEDGKQIVYDFSGNTVVKGNGVGPNWLVTPEGKYANDGKGHYIGVGAKSGVASPVDAKGAPIQNGNGQVPLWDPKTGSPMSSADGSTQIVLDKEGHLLQTTKDGQTVVEEKTSLPYMVDPRTRATALNSDTGRAILLDTSGAAIEYNADNGIKSLINLADNKTVKTVEGSLPIVIDDKSGMPVAVNPDGSKVNNPYTGNTVVYDANGQPAVEAKTGYKVEVTSDGKASLIDPKTSAPVGTRDKTTGGIQIYNKDGSPQTDPKTGNKVQLDPNGHRVEVDAATGKFATDAWGNALILGPDNAPLKTPAGQSVVADKSGAPIAVGADGKVVIDAGSKLPRVVNTDTGKLLEDPVTKASVVVDPKTGAPVQVDPKTGAPIIDPETGLTIVANHKTGEQAKGPNGEPIGVLPTAGAPVYHNKENNTLTLADPLTGKPVTNPKTGAQVIVSPQYGVPIQILPNKEGGYTVVDGNGHPRNDGFGNTLYLDKDTGRVVIKLPDGKMVDASTLKEPEKVDIKGLANAAPLGAAAAMPGGEPAIPLPVPTPATEVPAPYIPPAIDAPWASPDYTTTAAEQIEFIETYENHYFFWADVDASFLSYEEEAAAVEYLKNLPGNEALKDIPTPDLVALRLYTKGGAFVAVNRSMFSTPAAELQPYIKSIQSALNQMRKNGYSYTGPALRVLNMDVDEFKEMFTVGSYYRNKQFMSASYDPNWQWPGSSRLKFSNVTGVSVEPIAAYPGHSEIVVQPNVLLKTDSIDDWVPPAKIEIEGDMIYENDAGTSAEGGRKGTQATVHSVDEPGTKTSAPADPAPTAPEPVNPAAAQAAGKWAKLGKVLKYGGAGLGIGLGGYQAVTGGVQIDDGIKNKNSYDIASGAFNLASGIASIASSVVGLAGGIAAAAMPLAGLAAVFGMAAIIADILKHQDDHKKFADNLGNVYGPLGIFKEAWHEKAAQAYHDAHSEPDPAPIAHGNNP